MYRVSSSIVAILSVAVLASASDWPQFRGPHGTGCAATDDPLPVEIGPQAQSLVWKTDLPPGHSSPVVMGDRIFLTGERDGKLLTFGLDRESGKVLWEREAPYQTLEEIHNIGSHAQCTPAADAERVVVFFGSSGLYCYDHDGHPMWNVPMGPFANAFGAGSSPIIEDDFVILGQDHDQESFLMALDKRSGEVVWKTDRSEFPRNYCTPVIWNAGGRKQIVMAATLRVVGYDFDDGKELWTVRGISRMVCMTPVVGDDGNLFLAGWAAGGDETERIYVEPFDRIVESTDANGNGSFEETELPEGAILQRFEQVDRNKDGSITKAEYEYFRTLFDQGQNLILAIKPGAEGEATETAIAWKQKKQVPFCASPLYHDGLLFTVKDGGIVSCWDAKTGKPLKQQRLEAASDYYSSPSYGDGKLYLANRPGMVTVLSAAKEFEVLHTADFGEEIYASPAIAGGRIYLRTTSGLYCLGKK
jgi:outer membrane protein assembly factor BamB